MNQNDKPVLYEALKRAAVMYGKKEADVVGMMPLYFSALEHYDMSEVTRALSAHVRDPDSGQFWPKPADIVRVLNGPSESNAMRAWSKVEKAIRTVGPYPSVVFDDPGIHAVIADMGGWIQLCGITEDEKSFRAAEFSKRYRGFLKTGLREYPKRLTGITEGANLGKYGVDEPLLLGDPEAAMAVLRGGDDNVNLRVTGPKSIKKLTNGIVDEKID